MVGCDYNEDQLQMSPVEDILRVVHMQDFFPRKEKRRVTATTAPRLRDTTRPQNPGRVETFSISREEEGRKEVRYHTSGLTVIRERVDHRALL